MIAEKLRLLVSLFALCIGASAGAAEVVVPPYLRDLPLVERTSGVLEAEGKRIIYSVSYDSSGGVEDALHAAYSTQYVRDFIVDTSSSLLIFMKDRGIQTRDCRLDYNINIYIISPQEMLSRSRFESFFRSNNIAPITLYGVYDVTPWVISNSAIIISNFGRSQNIKSLSHELAHYWWDRLCTMNGYRGSSEQFAMEFEDYYWGLNR